MVKQKTDIDPHPAFIARDVSDGKKYRPSNGTEGDIFMSRFCGCCIKHPINSDAKRQCRILLKTFAYDLDDPKYPPQWLYKNGRPLCISFKDRDEEYKKRREARRKRLKKNGDDKTIDLFKK